MQTKSIRWATKQIGFITLLFALQLATNGQSNVYHPFPDSNAYWNASVTNVFHPMYLDHIWFGLNGDTLINNKVWHKVMALADSTLSHPDTYYYRGIREDDKRVYTINYWGEESILYDFNLQLGDTITYTYPELKYRVATYIDSVQLQNGEYRKRFVFADTAGNIGFTDTVIEGIGSVLNTGLFFPLVFAMATNGTSFHFNCFKQNEEVYYLNSMECDHCFCQLLSAVTESEAAAGMRVWPNPISGKSTVSTSRYMHNATLTLYDAMGREQLRISGFNGNSFTFDRGRLKAGVYLLKVSSEQQKEECVKVVLD